MKKIILLILFTVVTVTGNAVKVGTLSEVFKPSMITVNGNQVYVAEGAVFSIYSLKDLKLLRKFGRKGEGPGEFMERRKLPPRITVLKDRVFITGPGKAAYFSKNGRFQKEFKTNAAIRWMVPVGKNLVAKEKVRREEGKPGNSILITLYDSNMKKIKVLYSQNWVEQRNGNVQEMDMGLDYVTFAVANDKIFIDKSQHGFLIDVFDSNGNKLYEIKKEYQKQSITADDKNRLTDRVKNDPVIKRITERVGGWEKFSKGLRLSFPEHFAPIKGIDVAGKKIYVRTYVTKNEKEKYVVMDLKGNEIKTLYLPAKFETSLLEEFSDCKLYSLSGGRLYYIKENPDNEQWELHAEEL